MEHQKVNFSDNTPNQPTKFKKKNQVEINNESQGTCNKDHIIKFKTLILRSILCYYSNAYILVKGTITFPNIATDAAAPNNINKKVVFKICTPFANCINRINNTQVDNAHDSDVVMPMYDLKEYSDNYSKTSVTL